MITGPELIAKVKELGDVSKSVLVRECGYVSTKKRWWRAPQLHRFL